MMRFFRARRPETQTSPLKATFLTTAIAFVALLSACKEQREVVGDSSNQLTLLACCGAQLLTPGYYMPERMIVFDPLFDELPDGSLEGRLAATWEFSPDYRRLDVTLREDARWHDGAPVTSHDIAYSLQLYDGVIISADSYDIEVHDSLSFTLIFHRPEGGPILGYTTYMPKHLVENLDPEELNEWDFWTNPVGNGPYRFARYLPATVMEFEANEDYYRGRPKIDRVRLKFGGSAMAELLSGEVDAAGLDPMNTEVALRTGRFVNYQRWIPDYTVLAWNHENPLFTSARVRRALGLAIDRKAIAAALNLPPDPPVPAAPVSGRQWKGREFPSSPPRDTTGALTLLAEEDWVRKVPGGPLERQGIPFRFELTVGRFDVDQATLLSEQFGRIGVQVEIRPVGALARDRWESGDFEAILRGMTAGGVRNVLTSDSPLGYVNPRLDAIIDSLDLAFDPDETDRLFREIWDVFREDVPVQMLVPDFGNTLVHRRVKGFEGCSGGPAWCIDKLWIEEEGEAGGSEADPESADRGGEG